MHLTWGYDLVSPVQPGDRVLHWQTRAPRGLVGWSEVELISLIGEEFGMLGLFVLLLLYAFVVGRAIYLSTQTQDTYARLLAGSLGLTFFVYVFINAGMVSGLLPVVGVPLPLVSYGGSSMVTLLAGFGILMSLYSHRKLMGS